MLSLRVESEDTPLQNKLDALADSIGQLGLIFAVATLSLLVVKYFYLLDHPFSLGEFFSHFVKYLITAITMVVVAVPEGLPLAVTLSLAYSMMKMLRDNNLVRHLAACETMGGATAVCFFSPPPNTKAKGKRFGVDLWCHPICVCRFALTRPEP